MGYAEDLIIEGMKEKIKSLESQLNALMKDRNEIYDKGLEARVDLEDYKKNYEAMTEKLIKSTDRVNELESQLSAEIKSKNEIYDKLLATKIELDECHNRRKQSDEKEMKSRHHNDYLSVKVADLKSQMDKLIQAHDEAVESRDKILSRKIFLEKEVKDRGNKLYHAYVEIKELKRRADLYSLTESTEKYINELIADNNEMKSRLQKYSYPFEIKLSTFDERRINELKLENDKLKAELQRANGNIFRKSAEINNLENQNKILQMESSNADGINADLRKRNDALESELYNGTSAMVRCADCGKISAVDIRRNPVKEDMEVRVKQCACHKQNQDKLQQEIEKLKSNIDKKDHEIGRCYDNAAVLNGKIKRKEQEINELKTELSGYKIGVSLDNRICWEAVKEIKKDELKKEDCSNSKVLEEIEKLRCRVRRAEYDFDRRCGCLEDILVKR